MYQAVLADAKFHEQLLVFDRDLAASARAARCWLCGGALHSASYDRKPRGCPGGLCREYAERFSFCCAVDGCRKRTTPPSLRFLGRKVYLATMVTLISAMLLGTTPARLTHLSAVPGIDRRTLARWRTWWRSSFTGGPFAAVAKAALVPPLDIAGLPVGATLSYTRLAQLAYGASGSVTNLSGLLLNGGTADLVPALFGVVRAGTVTVA